MSALDVWRTVAFLAWLLVCVVTASVKDRGFGWAIAAWLLPPLYVVLLLLPKGTEKGPTRVRCPLCKLGWVPLDRLPRVCSGCGEEVPHHVLQKETHKDMM